MKIMTIVARFFICVLMTVGSIMHAGSYAWRNRAEAYIAPILVARSNHTPVPLIKPVLVSHCVQKAIELYNKKSTHILAMVARIDQQLDFLKHQKSHPYLCRVYQLPTQWFARSLNESEMREKMQLLIVRKNEYLALLGNLAMMADQFPHKATQESAHAWAMTMLSMIYGKPVSTIEKFEQMTMLEDVIAKETIGERRAVQSMTADAVISYGIDSGFTWIRRAATLAGILGATWYGYGYGQKISDQANNDINAWNAAAEHRAQQVQNGAQPIAVNLAHRASQYFQEEVSEQHEETDLDPRTRQLLSDIGTQHTWLNTSGQFARVGELLCHQMNYQINKIDKAARKFRNELVDEAEQRVDNAIRTTRAQLEASFAEQSKHYTQRGWLEFDRVKGKVYSYSALAAGAILSYAYIKRAMSKHGAVYTALKKNFQNMIYILTTHAHDQLAPEHLGDLMYIGKKIREYASSVLSSDELYLLSRDLDHIADPSVPAMSKLETLRFMQKNYSFLAQKQPIII